MRIAFCLSDFIKKNVQLQPWLTVHRLGREFIMAGHEVFVITDTGDRGSIDGITILPVPSLRNKGSGAIIAALKDMNPHAVIVSVTPLSLATSRWHGFLRQFGSYAYLSYPFYSRSKIARAFFLLDWGEWWPYGRHCAVPDNLWEKKLRRNFCGVFCQSQATAKRILPAVGRPELVSFIPPGIDKEFWNPEGKKNRKNNRCSFLYTGSAKKIRGLELLIKALSMLSDSNPSLLVLARGAGTRDVCDIQARLRTKVRNCRTAVKGGWLFPEELKAELQNASVVLFPFVLVPSEMPVSIAEAISCGTPVIVSDICGLPEVAGAAGITIPQADPAALACAMRKVQSDSGFLAKLEAACTAQSRHFPSWKDVASSWLRVLEAV